MLQTHIFIFAIVFIINITLLEDNPISKITHYTNLNSFLYLLSIDNFFIFLSITNIQE